MAEKKRNNQQDVPPAPLIRPPPRPLPPSNAGAALGQMPPGMPPQPPPQQQMQGVPNPMMQSVSANLMKIGFGFLGSAFGEYFNDPDIAKGFQEMGSDIAGTLHDRWWKAEYENFTASHGEDFKKNMLELRKQAQEQREALDRGVFIDPTSGVTQQLEPGSPQWIRMRSNIENRTIEGVSQLVQDYMGAAGKYATNPYINKEIENILAVQTGIIGQTFGPSASMESEGAMAGIEETQAHTGYLNRMPQAPAGSDTNERQMMGFGDVVNKKGTAGAMNWVTSNNAGREFLTPYFTAVRSQYAQQLMAEDPELQPDSAQLEELLRGKTDDIVKAAAGRLLVDTVGMEAASEFFKSGKGSRYRYEPEPNKITHLTYEQRLAVADDYVNRAIQTMPTLIVDYEPKTYDELVEMLMTQIKARIDEQFGPQSTARLAKKTVLDRIEKKLKNKEKIAEKVPMIAEKYMEKDDPKRYRGKFLLPRGLEGIKHVK